jgi:hypothetical protein
MKDGPCHTDDEEQKAKIATQPFQVPGCDYLETAGHMKLHWKLAHNDATGGGGGDAGRIPMSAVRGNRRRLDWFVVALA